jgi:hypothetical protein
MIPVLAFYYSYEIVSPADNSYGSLEEDGTWNGMVGMVMLSVSVTLCKLILLK